MAIGKNSLAVVLALIGMISGWGTAYLTNFDKLKRGGRLDDEAKNWARLREGHYQWQWGKGSWLGDLSIRKDDAGQMCATIDIAKYCAHSGAPIGKVLVSTRCGTVQQTADGQPKLVIPVRHTHYGEKCDQIGQTEETLVIVLNPKEAYTGSVDYIDTKGEVSTGGIGVINWSYQPIAGNEKHRTE